MTLTNNTISNNSANDDCGGVCIYSVDTATLTNNTISNNFANDIDGGIGADYVSTLMLSKNTIRGNFVNNDCGGVSVYSITSANLTNNTISYNTANDYGGGVCAQYSLTMTLTNNTMDNNTANSAGGVYIYLHDDNNSANIYNNIIVNNNAPQGADVYLDNDGNNNSTPSIVNLFNNDFSQETMVVQVPFPIDSSNLDNLDPLFVDALNDDYHPQATSPIINKGYNFAPGIPVTDKDDNPRIEDGIVDMGAFESGPKPHIDAISTALGPVGLRVTIIGVNFGDTQNTGTVTFDSTAAAVSSWSDTQIQVTVPSLLVGTYDIIVTTNVGSSNPVAFKVTSTQLNRCSALAQPGVCVTMQILRVLLLGD